jgi:hypothetical protein
MALVSRTVTAGTQIITYVMFSVVTISYLLLTDINTDAPFKANLIFYLMLLGSFFFVFAISFTNIFERKLGGENGARFFFFSDVSIGKFLIYVPIGLLGSFGLALVSQNLGLGTVDSALVSIGGSGTVMMVIFFITKTIMIPIIIHATFNTIVIALRDGVITSDLLGLELVPLPNVTITVSQFNQFFTDVLIQYTLVSPAEEMLKMLIIAFIVLSIPNARFKDGIAKYIGAFFALVIWTSFHLLVSL